METALAIVSFLVICGAVVFLLYIEAGKRPRDRE